MADGRKDAGTGGEDDRSWADVCDDDEHTGRGRHRGRGPKDWSRDDRRLYEAVCERLLRDGLIDARGIEVAVEDGVVTLSGEARGAADPALAERLVRATPGVKDVGVELRINRDLPDPAAQEPPAEEDDGRTDRSPRGYPILPM